MVAMLMVAHNTEVAFTRTDVGMGNGLIVLLKTTKAEILDTATHLGPHATDPLQCYQAPTTRVSILRMAINRLMTR